MSQYQRLFLMVGSDLRHTPALERAAALAHATGATLHICAFVDEIDTLGLMSGDEHRLDTLMQNNRQWLADEATLLHENGIRVSTEVILARDVLQAALAQVAEITPDLLIKDVQHEPLLKRLVVAPLDWQLLRECPCPVHLVSEVHCPLPRIVIAAVDPTHPEHPHDDLNESVINAAADLARQCNAELHLLHVCDSAHTHMADFGAGTVTMPGFGSDVRKSIHKAFEQMAARHGVTVERQHFLSAPITRSIAEFIAHSRADVLVMGNHPRKLLERLTGSTTEHVLEQRLCNVLAIRAAA
ncbi:universal stress protein [Pseudomonas sp. BIGb0427]|uniref:universal stress protein n=1 Tax=unclassified Pseudomonas TaxID=196821 RepID=UPI0016AC1855|nr:MULTISPECIES: universal stress protein [unclassified Pseudomonas]NLU60308.1 universal stress protein [Pseudomonas sp. BIGb0427]QPG61783.1 universal stress protein [Pseudomonas sp. BIGb0427]UVM69294.1 universal stress protein [Pseudomonas sp. B21-009]